MHSMRSKKDVVPFKTSGKHNSNGHKTNNALNYYEVLHVANSASQDEIDHAYRIAVKESSLDKRVVRTDIELAYAALSDLARRAHYDHRLEEEKKRLQLVAKSDRREALRRVSIKLLRVTAAALIVFSIGFLYFRYGYFLKSFEIGDHLYYQDTHDYLGEVMDFQSDHNFGSNLRNGILIKKNDGTEFWFPTNNIKAFCYKETHPPNSAN